MYRYFYYRLRYVAPLSRINRARQSFWNISHTVGNSMQDIQYIKIQCWNILLYSFIASMTGAALRLGIIHHYDAQKIIHQSKPIISDTVIKNIQRPLSGIWQFCPGLDINQIKHERMHSKCLLPK